MYKQNTPLKPIVFTSVKALATALLEGKKFAENILDIEDNYLLQLSPNPLELFAINGSAICDLDRFLKNPLYPVVIGKWYEHVSFAVGDMCLLVHVTINGETYLTALKKFDKKESALIDTNGLQYPVGIDIMSAYRYNGDAAQEFLRDLVRSHLGRIKKGLITRLKEVDVKDCWVTFKDLYINAHVFPGIGKQINTMRFSIHPYYRDPKLNGAMQTDTDTVILAGEL